MIVSSIGTLSWIISGTDFIDYMIAHLIVWSGVWAVHWRLGCRSSRGGTVRRQVYLLLGAAAGTIGLAISASFVVGHLLNWAYDGSMPGYIPDYGFGPDEASWDSAVYGARDATPAMLTFGAVWFWYWWRNARGSGHSVERHAFVLVGGVLGGLGGGGSSRQRPSVHSAPLVPRRPGQGLCTKRRLYDCNYYRLRNGYHGGRCLLFIK